MRSAHLKVPCRQLPSSPSSGRRLRLADSIREHLQAHGDRWQMQRRKGIGARALAQGHWQRWQRQITGCLQAGCVAGTQLQGMGAGREVCV